MEPLELRFRADGPFRRLVLAFFGLWLSLWALLLLAALAAMAAVVRSWMQSSAPASPEALLALATVLIVWLSLWSTAGVLALRHWSGSVATQDRLRLSATTLEIQQRLAWLQRRRSLPREAIQAVLLAPDDRSRASPLIAQLRSGQVALTHLGSEEERQRACRLLQQALAVSLPAAPEPLLEDLPAAWRCEQRGFDTALLVPPAQPRRRRALALLLLAVPAAAVGVLLLLLHSQGRPVPLALLLAPPLIAGLATTMALRLGLGRQEWRLGDNQLVSQQRFAGRVRPQFTIRRLELLESIRADGSIWYTLLASDLARLAGRRLRQGSQVICRVPHDPGEPRALGRWLASRARIPFRDLERSQGPG